MKSIFSVLQKIGRAFMLPIAILPMAGILLGVGGAFTNPTLIQTYNLHFLAEGTLMNKILILIYPSFDRSLLKLKYLKVLILSSPLIK